MGKIERDGWKSSFKGRNDQREDFEREKEHGVVIGLWTRWLSKGLLKAPSAHLLRPESQRAP
jgi:hypothetical protein